MEQFCIYCQRETSAFVSNPNGSDTFIDVHAFNSYSGGDYTRSPCPTFSGADGLVIYGVPSDYGLTMNMGYTQVGLVFNFSAPWQPRDLYNGASLSFYYGAALVHGEPDNHDFKIMTDPYYNRAAPDPIDLYKDNAFCLASTESVKDFNSKYISDWAAFHSFGTSMDSTFASSSDGRTVWMVIGLCPPGVPPHTVQPSARDFYFTAPYIDPDGGTTLQPGDSGFDILGGIFEMIKKILESIVNLPSKIAEAVKGFFDMVVNAIVKLGQTILDGLKSLFIPSDGYFEGKANEMRTWLEQHLGLLVYPFTLVADLADRVAGLSNGEPVVHVPEIAYIQDTEKYVLIAEQDVNIYDQVNRKQIFLDIHKYYLMAMDAAIAMALVVLAWKKFDQITGGRDT